MVRSVLEEALAEQREIKRQAHERLEARICKSWAEHRTIKAVADAVGCGTSTVETTLKKHGLYVPTRGPGSPPRPKSRRR